MIRAASGEKNNASALDPATSAAFLRILAKLPGIERRVLELRFGLTGGHPRSRSDVAVELRMSASEVDEIAERGLERLRVVGDMSTMRKVLRHLSSAR